jgi:hypothetical protein
VSRIELARYSSLSGDFGSRSAVLSCGGFEADGPDECIKIIDDPVVEAVELGSPFVGDSGIGADRAEETRSQRGVDSFEHSGTAGRPSNPAGGVDSGENSEVWQRDPWPAVWEDRSVARQAYSVREHIRAP